VPVALITGVSGQDGTFLAERLLAEGFEVHGLVRPSDPSRHDVFRAYPDIVFHEGDLAEPSRLVDLVRDVAPDELYNLAGISSVAQSWDEPVATGIVTGVAVAGILEGAARVAEEQGRSPRVVQASSAEIFGWPATAPQDETTAVRPVSPYGAAKAYAHHMVSVYRSRGVHASACILYNHESTRRPRTFVTRKITSAVAGIARGDGTMLALGNLDARRDWGWAPDYVDAMVRAARHERADDFVIATGTSHTVSDFVRIAFARAGIEDWRSRVEIDARFSRPVDSPEFVGDASKARRLLCWGPSVTFEEIVHRMVDHDLAGLDGGR